MSQVNQCTTIFVTFNRPEHFAKVVNSVKQANTQDMCQSIVIMQGDDARILSIVNRELPNARLIRVKHADFYSPKQRINANIKLGLVEAFSDLNCEYAVVIEDDILVAPNFFVFISKVMEKYERDDQFRGINGFSALNLEVANCLTNTCFVRCNFGLGWGWAINRRNYQKVSQAWDGTEDEHWDSLVESYVRTGFVVNPVRSLVKNIGLDGSGHHTGVNKALDHAMLNSFDERRTWMGDLIEVSNPFPWRADCITLSHGNSLAARALFLLWKSVWSVKLLSKKFEEFPLLRLFFLRTSGRISLLIRRITVALFGKGEFLLNTTQE